MEIYIDREFVLHHLPVRPRAGHKGTFGTLLVLAGSTRYRGAAALAAEAALRAGAGLVRLASTAEVCDTVAARQPACIFEPLPATEAGGIDPAGLPAALSGGHTAVLAGCGMGNTAETAALTRTLLQEAKAPLVLDADALNVLAGHVQGEEDRGHGEGLGLLRAVRTPLVLTPHIGEMARLVGLETKDVLTAPEAIARRFASEQGCVVVLKSHRTVVVSPGGGVFLLDGPGNPGLARGGSGDVLAGIIASLLAQGFPPEVAAACGVWLHAEAGRKAAQQDGEAGLSTASLPAFLGTIWRELGR